jgi:hypothetical protein
VRAIRWLVDVGSLIAWRVLVFGGTVWMVEETARTRADRLDYWFVDLLVVYFVGWYALILIRDAIPAWRLRRHAVHPAKDVVVHRMGEDDFQDVHDALDEGKYVVYEFPDDFEPDAPEGRRTP